MIRFKYSLLVLTLIFASTVFSQIREDIAVRAFYYNNTVLLRWKLSDAESYAKCSDKGFVVERRETGEQWQRISNVEKGTFEDIDNMSVKSSKANVLKMVLYKEKYLQQLLSENPSADKDSLRRVFYGQIKGQDDDLYEILLLSAEMDVDIARFAALNYMDDHINTQQNYEYRIRPADPKLKYSSQVVKVQTIKNDVLPAMTQLKVVRNRENLIFKWSMNSELKNGYSAYEMERSVDGKKYEIVNDAPIIHLVSIESTKDTCIYTDTLPKCGKTYYYRVRGFNRFGLSGPYSNVVTTRCDDDLTVYPKIESIEFNKNGEAEIKWTAENPDNQTIKGFEVQRSAKMTADKTGFETISKRLSSSTVSFVDKKPLKMNFYRVVAYGENENQSNYGNIVYAHPHDTLPPSIPTGLKGVIDSAGVVTLTWNDNPEPDIRGYRVYFANDSNDVFVAASDTFLKTALYTDTLFLGSLTNDIYYKVSAIGDNYGQSEQSAAVKLIKPDTIAPANAVVDSVYQDSVGTVVLEWIDSPSRDLEETSLLRLRDKALVWDTLASWKGKTTPMFFKDTAEYDGMHVKYKILVKDESGNVSESADYVFKTRYVKPHCAKDLHLTVDKNRGEIELHWAKCGCDVFTTRIYRIVDGVQRLLVTLEGQETGYVDNKISIGHTYQYVILPITKKMSQIEKSEIVEF